MRRSEQEITDKKALETILKQALVCRIGLSDADMPYIVPVCFGYADDCIYIHSSPFGRKMEILKNNNVVCFEVDMNIEPVKGETACKWSIRYVSIIGYGKAYIVQDHDEKRKGLDVLMKQYSDLSDHSYREEIMKRTAVIKIEIESMTGKKSKT
jgi:uncharacterized protein